MPPVGIWCIFPLAVVLSAVMAEDHYSVLGVERDASIHQVKIAYRKLSLKWHPDRHQKDDKKVAQEKFIAIGLAHEVLSTPTKRATYNIYGQRGLDYDWVVKPSAWDLAKWAQTPPRQPPPPPPPYPSPPPPPPPPLHPSDLFGGELSGIEELTEKMWNELIDDNASRRSVVVLFYRPDTVWGELLKGIFFEFGEKFAVPGILELGVINCKQQAARCTSELGQTMPPLPRIRYYGPYPDEPIVFEKPAVAFETLARWALDVMADFCQVLTSESEFRDWLAADDAVPKILLFTDRRATPPLLKALSIEFLRRASFAVVLGGSPGGDALTRLFRVSNRAALMHILDEDTLEADLFDHKLEREELSQFVSSAIGRHRADEARGAFFRELTADRFDAGSCSPSCSHLCLLLLLDPFDAKSAQVRAALRSAAPQVAEDSVRVFFTAHHGARGAFGLPAGSILLFQPALQRFKTFAGNAANATALIDFVRLATGGDLPLPARVLMPLDLRAQQSTSMGSQDSTVTWAQPPKDKVQPRAAEVHQRVVSEPAAESLGGERPSDLWKSSDLWKKVSAMASSGSEARSHGTFVTKTDAAGQLSDKKPSSLESAAVGTASTSHASSQAGPSNDGLGNGLMLEDLFGTGEADVRGRPPPWAEKVSSNTSLCSQARSQETLGTKTHTDVHVSDTKPSSNESAVADTTNISRASIDQAGSPSSDALDNGLTSEELFGTRGSNERDVAPPLAERASANTLLRLEARRQEIHALDQTPSCHERAATESAKASHPISDRAGFLWDDGLCDGSMSQESFGTRGSDVRDPLPHPCRSATIGIKSIDIELFVDTAANVTSHHQRELESAHDVVLTEADFLDRERQDMAEVGANGAHVEGDALDIRMPPFNDGCSSSFATTFTTDLNHDCTLTREQVDPPSESDSTVRSQPADANPASEAWSHEFAGDANIALPDEGVRGDTKDPGSGNAAWAAARASEHFDWPLSSHQQVIILVVLASGIAFGTVKARARTQ